VSDRIEVSLSRADRELLKRIANALEALSSDKSEGPKRLVEGSTAEHLDYLRRDYAPYWGDEPSRGNPETD
jgi:hypothetical protein